MVDWYLAVADWLHGRLAEAERRLADAVAEQYTIGARYLSVSISWDLGKVRQALGDLDGALRAYEQALEIVTEAGLPLPLAGMAYLGMADVLYERDDLDAAARHARTASRCAASSPSTQPLATGLARLAWIRQARGDRAGALGGDDRGPAAGARPGCGGPAQPRPGAAGAAAAGPRRHRRGRRLGSVIAASAPATSRTTALSRNTLCWRACCWRKVARTRRLPCWNGG